MLLALSLALANDPSAVDAQLITPPHGWVLHESSTAYDSSTESILALGGVTSLGAGQQVHINGRLVGGVAGPRGVALGTDVAMGPNVPWWHTGPSWPSWVASSRFIDPTKLLLPVFVEAFDSNGRVTARTRHLVVDGRGGDRIYWSRDVDRREAGLEMHLTLSGMEVFEESHDAMMVHPDLTTFNARLDDRVAAFEPYEDDFEACFPITAHPDFKTLPAWFDVYAQAIAQKELHDQLEDAADAAFLAGRFALAATQRAAAQLLCVREDVVDDAFEVCVHHLEVDPTGMTAGAFGRATLYPGPLSALSSDYTFEDLDATFDLTLRDMEIRWAEGGSVCTPRPQADIAADRFFDTAWLAAFSFCPDQHLLAAVASPVAPNDFRLAVDASDPERLDVSQLTESNTFLAAYAVDLDHTCDEGFIRGITRTNVEASVSSVGLAVGQTWDDGWPYTDQAEALELLFSGFDLGTFELPYTDGEAWYQPVSVRGDRGLVFAWDTAAAPRTGTHWHSNLTRWMRHDTDPIDAPVNGLTPDGEPYDLKVRMSTDYINQHLQGAAAEPHLIGDLELTWNDFGANPPMGVDPDSPMPLTGANLAQWAPPLLFLGPDLRLAVKQTLPPFVMVPPDANVAAADDQPVLLSWGHVEVQLLQPRPSGDRVVFSVAFDLYDQDLRTSLVLGGDEPPYLYARAGQMSVDPIVIVNDLAVCRPWVNATLPQFGGACERVMETVLEDTFGSALERRLLDAVNGVPVPRFFDAQGQTPDPVRIARQVDRVSLDGFITWFLELD